MRWLTLINNIRKPWPGELPLSVNKQDNIYALLLNPKTGYYERVYLELRYGCNGPYFVQDKKAQAVYEREQDKEFNRFATGK